MLYVCVGGGRWLRTGSCNVVARIWLLKVVLPPVVEEATSEDWEWYFLLQWKYSDLPPWGTGHLASNQHVLVVASLIPVHLGFDGTAAYLLWEGYYP